MSTDGPHRRLGRAGYLWAELGSLVGAIVAGILAAIGWGVGLYFLLFGDDGWVLVLITGVALALVIAGSGFGCRVALRRKGLPAAERTAWILVTLLVVLYAVAFWSSDTWLQSDLLPFLAVAAPVMPLLARKLAIVTPAGPKEERPPPL